MEEVNQEQNTLSEFELDSIENKTKVLLIVNKTLRKKNTLMEEAFPKKLKANDFINLELLSLVVYGCQVLENILRACSAITNEELNPDQLIDHVSNQIKEFFKTSFNQTITDH